MILDKYISTKKSRISENSENPARFLLCSVDFTNSYFEHFEVYLYNDIMGIFSWHWLILIARKLSKCDFFKSKHPYFLIWYSKPLALDLIKMAILISAVVAFKFNFVKMFQKFGDFDDFENLQDFQLFKITNWRI